MSRALDSGGSPLLPSFWLAYNSGMANPGTVKVVQGANLWQVLRTDRDGASQDEIPQMAAAMVRWTLREVDQSPLYELTRTGPNEWTFGSVRPLAVAHVSHSAQSFPRNSIVLGTRYTSVPGTVPTVRGESPWYVLLSFMWRKPSVSIPWPGVSEGLFGRKDEVNGADWVLQEARTMVGQDPGDATWMAKMGKHAESAAKSATSDLERVALAAGAGIGLVLLLYFALSSRRW
jgi:hypothetical protein